MPIDNKLISGLVQQLKYMPDVVEALVGHKFRDKEVTEAQLDALLKDFLNEEHDAIQTVKISERTKRQQVRTDRQKECDTNKANKVQPFDLKVYNKNLLAAAANVTGIAAKIAYAKRPEVVAATTEALTEAHQDLIAAAFGKNQAERVEFTQNFEALRALDAQLAAEVFEKVTARSADAAPSERTYFGRAYAAVTNAAANGQNMVYQGLIYKIAKYEVRANMVVAAFKAGGDWRKDIELVKADARFKKDMEQVAKKVGPENAKEVAEAQNVILALNLRFGKDEVQADKKWFITVVLKGMAAGIAESLARKQEVEPPPRVVGEIGNPMLIAAPDSLAKYDPKKTFKVGVVPAATANQAKMANVVQGLANVKLNPVAKPLDTGNQPAVVPTHDSHKTTSSRKIDIHTNKPVAPGKVPEPPPRKSRGGGPNNSTS